jgi:hypothetical protein
MMSATVRLPARSAATATTTTTAATTATAGATTTASAASGLRTGFIDVQRAAIHFLAIELGDSRFRIAALGHFDKCKTTGLAAVAVRYDVNALDAAILRKSLLQVFLRGLVTQVSDKDIRHSVPLFNVFVFVGTAPGTSTADGR